MQKITPCLWFDGNAEEAVAFYRSVFEPEGPVDILAVSEAGPGKPGSALAVTFRLAGQEFMALNGGPQFPFTPAISLFVACRDQAEIDRLWTALSAGGQTQRCGWLNDRFGVSWQIVPTRLGELLGDPDRAKAARVMRAMLAMTRLDIAGLEQAALEGDSP